MSASPWTGEARDREAMSFLSASLDHLLGCTEKSLLSSAQHRPPRGGQGATLAGPVGSEHGFSKSSCLG